MIVVDNIEMYRVHYHGDTRHFETQYKHRTNMEGGEERLLNEGKKENIIYMTH